MSDLDRAIVIAVEAHAGQFDRAGEPYILHPLRVMMSVSTTEERIVAVLHDVVEDCPEWDLSRLQEEGFSDSVIAGIDSVTKRRGEPYMVFIDRARWDPIGRVVKRADLNDNIDQRRLGKLPKAEADRLHAKYFKALVELL